jgi:aminopeptidase N
MRSGFPRKAVLLCLGMATLHAFAQPPSEPDAGISHELAIARAARVSDLYYSLSFSLTPHAESMPGHETVRFTLSDAKADLPIDYREGKLTAATLNGVTIPVELKNGHLVLPAAQLHSGENTLETDFTSRIAKAGAAITRYDDKEDNSEYFYSLFVPMDADMAFPCFDQPDLKARFTLDVATWADPNVSVISNGLPIEETHTIHGHQINHHFEETKPISTYLFAFAAGPWAKLPGKTGEPNLYVRKSQLARAKTEAPHVQEMTARGIRFLSDYFQQPFPFPKYDLVLIPGFPFGGMEHAGATFLNETGVLFRSAPTAADQFQRDTLTLHELTHQWFGDLVTMRWFDDLWLKEGFAQFMAYRALAELEPASQPWKHMYEDIKPLAYGIDETEGTTPIFQQIPNLKDAKSAYGAIVYQKAPSILKQLNFRLGDEAFRNGLRSYLKGHAYANAQWADLVNALQASSGQDLQPWAKAWVLQRGMPEITTSWTCSSGHLGTLSFKQRSVLGDNSLWPISMNVLLVPAEGQGQTVRIDWPGGASSWSLFDRDNLPCPRYVFSNEGDEAYGRFLLDAKSEPAVKELLIGRQPPEPLLRSMLWGALWENVHTANSAPRGYVELALKDLPTQDDETLARIQYGRANTALQRYITGPTRGPLVAQLESIATDRMLHGPTVGLRINAFRALTGVAETDSARSTLKSLLNGSTQVPGVELRPLDRWNMIGRLIAINDPDAASLLAAEAKRDTTDDGRKYAFAVQAGAPDAAVKQRYFEAYTTPPASPSAQQEDWLSQSVGPFNNVRQSTLTLPYLSRALDQLPEIKRDRRIFYLGVWLGGFLGGQTSLDAEAIVKEWLAKPGIDADLRRKVLENADPLERTVRIRAKFPE